MRVRDQVIDYRTDRGGCHGAGLTRLRGRCIGRGDAPRDRVSHQTRPSRGRPATRRPGRQTEAPISPRRWPCAEGWARAVRWPAPWPGQRHGLARTGDTALTTGPASLPLPPLVSWKHAADVGVITVAVRPDLGRA